MKYNPKCKDCGYWNAAAKQCWLSGMVMTEEDYCSKYTNSPSICAQCHGIIPPNGPEYLIENNGIYNIYCGGCYQQLFNR